MPPIKPSALLAGLATLTLSVCAASLQSAAPAAAAGGRVAHLLSCGGRQLVRPLGNVVLACGDANLAIRGTHWSSWTASAARGTTTLEINLCKPNCAAAKMSSFPGSAVALSGVKRGSSGPVFSRARITYRHAGRQTTVIAYPRT